MHSQGTTAAARINDGAGPSRANPMLDPSVFTFSVPWEQLPADLMTTLDEASRNQEPATTKDKKELRLAIAEKLLAAFKTHMENFPHKNKTPGRAIYIDVTDQVFSKFGRALMDIINGRIIGNGKSGFLSSLEHCIENKTRFTKSSNPAKKAKLGRGIVGVIPEQHRPQMTPREEEDFEDIRKELQNKHEALPWDLDEIDHLMERTYKLQRKDIFIATEEIDVALTNQEEQPIDDELEPKALATLKMKWPFLFRTRWLTIHHRTLTNRSLQEPLEEFMEQRVDDLLQFLITKGKVVQNLSVMRKLEGKRPSLRVLAVIHMLANIFNEKTTPLIKAAEVRIQLPQKNLNVPKKM